MEGGRTSPLGALGHGVSIAHGPPQSITHDHIKQGARERIGGRKMKLNFIQQGEQLKRETEISKNLQLFKKRDLGKANQWRLSSGAGDGALQAATLPAAAGDFGSPARRRRDDAASDSPTNTSIADSQPTLHQGKFGARSRLFGADKANREGEFATQGPSILFHTTCMDGLESMRAKTLPGAPHTNPSSVVPLGMSTTLTLPDATGNTSAVANATAADVPDNMSIGGMSARSGPPPSNAATAASQQQELAKVYRNVEKIWVERRAREVEDRLEEMEFKDTVNMWNYEQARLEEESNRRQESYQMSSQTGKQCHRILYRPSTAPTQKVAPAPPVMVNEAGLLERPISQQEKHRTQMAFGGETRKPHPPGSSPSGAFLTEAPLSPATGASPPAAGQEGGFASTAAQLLGGAMPGVSLSPYENYDPCTEKSDMRLLHKEERRGLDALTVGDEPEVDLEIDTDALAAGRPAGGQSRGVAARLGAIQGLQATGPKGLTHTHPEALVSTSLINAELDVVPDRTTVFAPSQAAAISRGKKDPEKKPAAEEPKGKAGSRPSTRGSSRPTSSARPAGKKGKAPRKPVDPNCIDQLFPPMSIAEQVPSLVRTQQMQQIEAVREAFAKHGISMPTSVLEGGLLTPQDQPYQSCLNDLPGPDMGFVPDWTKQTSKGKKKKKGGKKKKKRG